MTEPQSYTIEEIASLLKVSKLTVYDLVKKGKLPAFRVGRQMRITADDLRRYIDGQKGETSPVSSAVSRPVEAAVRPIIISGQDAALDLLGVHLEKNGPYQSLRTYTSSLNGLIALYKGQCDIVSVHLFDGQTGEYNRPYVEKLLTGHAYIMVNVMRRPIGFYVSKGNPRSIQTWRDLGRSDVVIVNREKGAGARVLLDEQLRLHGLLPSAIRGYEREETSHLSVASAVASGLADVGIGTEKVARMAGVEFIPLMNEQYDVVMLRTPENESLIASVLDVLRSDSFRAELEALGGYDVSQTGRIIAERG
ncbi:helix-turn-helix transcriptional regulator [Geobacillus stearothermophilus]|uniref:helix-turn-helix transcriptional regulator n=1 Tax=Geobacillus stearothermophilus TaxID=1422 RepID=UPI002E1A3313|nr:helix-turn-helix transcriptional regulator [Geobacillus stearothermophilus]